MGDYMLLITTILPTVVALAGWHDPGRILDGSSGFERTPFPFDKVMVADNHGKDIVLINKILLVLARSNNHFHSGNDGHKEAERSEDRVIRHRIAGAQAEPAAGLSLAGKGGQ